MLPADPPPPTTDSVADVPARPAGSAPPRPRRPPADSRARTPAFIAEWTTSREEALECAGCGASFVLAYKYRFVEGLAATVVRCPAAACRQGREYFLPVNAFDVLVSAPGGAAFPLRS